MLFLISVYLLIYLFFIVQQSIFMNFKVFLLISVLPIFLSKYPPIFTDISDISVKSKYRYIRNYRYFVPWSSLMLMLNHIKYFFLVFYKFLNFGNQEIYKFDKLRIFII